MIEIVDLTFPDGIHHRTRKPRYDIDGDCKLNVFAEQLFPFQTDL